MLKRKSTKNLFQIVVGIAILMLMLCVMTLFPSNGNKKAFGVAMSGAGTSSNPYIITDESHFTMMNGSVANFKLGNNITMSDSFSTIHTFGGFFDGNGFAIINLKKPFVGTTLSEETEIRKVGFFNPSIVIENINDITSAEGSTHVGIIANVNYGIITECYVSADFDAGENQYILDVKVSASYVGGMIGTNYGNVSSLALKGKIKSAANPIGAIVGYMASGTIRYTYALSSLENQSNSQAEVGTVYRTNIDLTSSKQSNIFGALNSERIQIVSSTSTERTLIQMTGDSALSNMGINSAIVGQQKFVAAKTNTEKTFFLPSLIAFKDNPLTDKAFGFDLFGKSSLETNLGTSGNPYLISNTLHLRHLAMVIRQTSIGDYKSRFLTVTTDLDFAGKTFLPIGQRTIANTNVIEKPFNGNINFNSKIVKNLTIEKITDNSNYVGMFELLGRDGTISNIIMRNNTFKGNEIVGSVVALSYGTVKGFDVDSSNSISGTKNIGGIIGRLDGGYIHNGICYPALSGSTSVYGLVGVTANNAQFNNAWYMTSNTEYINNGFGSILYLDRNTDKIETIAEINFSDYKISFTATKLADDINFIYRSVSNTDKTLLNTSVYQPLNSEKDSIYLRIVKELKINNDNGISTVSGSGWYYDGQEVELHASVKSGNFFDQFNLNGGHNTIGKLRNDNSGNIAVTFTMNASDAILIAQSKAIDTSLLFDASLYNKTAQQQMVVADNNDIETTYLRNNVAMTSTPLNVGSYSVNFVVKNSDRVILGKMTYDYRITPIKIDLTETALIKVKQFDNSISFSEFSETFVLQNFVRGIIQGDDVKVLAALQFPDINIGTHKTANYKFALNGSAESNYLAPDPLTINDGEIIKREIKISIEKERLSKIYDTKSTPISDFGLDNQGGIPLSIDTIRLPYTKDGLPSDGINVGNYGITIDHNTNGTYNLSLKEPYVYVVKPHSVTVNFANFTNLVFNTAEQNIKATYVDLNNVIKDAFLTYKKKDSFNQYQPIDNVVNAGEYEATATSIDENYCIIGTNTKEFSIVKSQQSMIKVENFNIGNSFKYADKTNLALDSNFIGNGDGVVSFDIVSGNGTISDNILTANGGGNLKLTATRGESENYFEKLSEVFATYVQYIDLDIGIRPCQFEYSDTISFQFYFNTDQFVGQEKDENLTSPIGLELPEVLLNNDPFDSLKTYDVNIYELSINQNSGSSTGYKFVATEFNISGTSLKIIQKKVQVLATGNSKIYGQGDPSALGYVIRDMSGNAIDHTLQGTLVRESGENVGDYSILEGDIKFVNASNLEIIFTSALFSITPAPLSIIISDEIKVFGEIDPVPTIELSGLVLSDTYPDVIKREIERNSGENVGAYSYIVSSLQISSNYAVTSSIIGGLRILPATPTIIVGDIATEVEYGLKLSSTIPKIASSSVDGNLSWKDGDILPQAIMGSTSSYIGVFTPKSSNYKAIEFDVSVKIIKRKISVIFDSLTSNTYTGKEQKNVKYSFTNIYEDDNIGDTLTYSASSLIKVGTYHAEVKITNPNYEIVGTSTFEFKITPAELKISIKDLFHKEDVVPTVEYIYIGFVNNETKDILKKLPTINLLTTPGEHKIKPYGAEAENYIFIYIESKQIIAKAKVQNLDLGITISGEMHPDLVLVIKELNVSADGESYAKAKDSFTALSQNESNLSNLKMMKYFDFALRVEGEDIALEKPLKVTYSLPASVRERSKLTIIMMKADGTLKVMNDLKREGDEVSFEISDIYNGMLIVAKPDYTWIFQISAIVLVLIFLLSIDSISEKLGMKSKKKKE